MEVFATKLKSAEDFIDGELEKGNDKVLVHVLAFLQRKLKNEVDYMLMFKHAQLSKKQLFRREKIACDKVTCETRTLAHAYRCRNNINTFTYDDLRDQMGMCTFEELVDDQHRGPLWTLREKGLLAYFDKPNRIHQFTDEGLSLARAILDKNPNIR